MLRLPTKYLWVALERIYTFALWISSAVEAEYCACYQTIGNRGKNPGDR
jgi:hypothetical protein